MMSPVVLYVVFAFLVAILGRKGYFGFWGALFGSILVTPMVACLVLLLLHPPKYEDDDD